MAELTLKQEHFIKAYIETGNASEAYRIAYDADKMKAETIHRKASELMNNGKIRARLNELQTEHKERHNMTVDDLIKELDEAREIAKENGNPTAMISAVMGKAKLLGLDKPQTQSSEDIQDFAEWLKESEQGL